MAHDVSVNPETRLTYLEAALRILKDAKRPLTTREITEYAILSGLIRPVGKTPTKTMDAVLYRAIQANSEIRKISEHARQRAKHGTVYWTLADTGT